MMSRSVALLHDATLWRCIMQRQEQAVRSEKSLPACGSTNRAVALAGARFHRQKHAQA